VLSAGIASKSSVYAEEGTAAHALGEFCLTESAFPLSLVGTHFNYDDHGAPKTITVTEEMAEAVNIYVEYCRSIRGVMHVEHRFDLSELHEGLFGTSDCVIFDEKEAALHVIDYKHGAGKPVDVIGNRQLRYYAVGAMTTLGYSAAKIVITIVQPRCEHAGGHIRSECIDVIDLIDWTADLIGFANAVYEAEESGLTGEKWNEKYLADGDHCRKMTGCPAAATCPKLAHTAISVANEEFHTGKVYDIAKMAVVLEKIPLIKAWIKNVEEFALEEASYGRVPPGYKIVGKRAVRNWRNEKEAEGALTLLGIDGIYNAPTLRTVAQIEKLIPKENRAILESLSVKESSGKTLVPDKDSRQAVKYGAIDDFS
jgi:hypothetical protein